MRTAPTSARPTSCFSGCGGRSATPRPNLSGFTGTGLFRGRWRGTLGAPVFEGRFSGRDVGYAGVVWGKAEWAGSADAASVRSHSLVLSRGGAELWLDGLVETGFFGAQDALDARVRLSGWPAEDIVKAMSWDLEGDGRAHG